MIRYVVLAIGILMVASVLFALIVSAVILLTMIAAVAIPCWLVARYWARQHGIAKPKANPLDRLQNLYIEGKIDILEFERAVAQLIAVEH